ncbi:MAG: hypothetical protein RLZZ574_527 [Cyanobacteriota bacterium]
MRQRIHFLAIEHEIAQIHKKYGSRETNVLLGVGGTMTRAAKAACKY